MAVGPGEEDYDKDRENFGKALMGWGSETEVMSLR